MNPNRLCTKFGAFCPVRGPLTSTMSKVHYSVITTLPNQAIANEYVAWLEGGHVDAVIKGGAHTGMIVRLERSQGDGLGDESVQIMTQYVFSTRQQYDNYVAVHAPALRADGLAKFGPERGVRMQRLLGEIL